MTLLPPSETTSTNPPQAEFNRYKSVCAAENVPVPKRPAFLRKISDINALVQRPWTEAELASKLSRQTGLKIRYGGLERSRLQKGVDDARARGDEARAARLEAELDGAETPRLAFRTSLAPAKGGGAPRREGPSQQDRLALLNLANRQKNAESVRQAQLKDRARARELEARRARGEVGEGKGVRARLNGGTPDKASKSQTGGVGAVTDEELVERMRIVRREQEMMRGGIPTIHKPLMDDDIIGALDLGIDVDIDL